MDQDAGTPFIVVGVDGSDSSKDALRWAAGQARLTGATVHAIASWDFPSRRARRVAHTMSAAATVFGTVQKTTDGRWSSSGRCGPLST